VLDDNGKYGVYSSSGSLLYSENLNLPVDPLVSQPGIIYIATIDATGLIRFVLTDGISYNYGNGAVATSQNNAITSWTVQTLPVKGIPDFVGVYYSTKFRTYSVSSAGYLDRDTSVDMTNMYRPYNVSYILRTATHPLLNEISIVGFSNYVVTLHPTLVSGVLTSNTTNANYANSQFVFSQASLITSSIGLSLTHMAYTYFGSRASSTSVPPNNLVVHLRTLASFVTITLPVQYGTFWSTVIHPTLPKIYCLSISGDLYIFDFVPGTLPSTPPSFATSTPSGVYLNLYDKNANMEVLDSTTLQFRTDEALSFFDLTTHTFTFHLNRKPTFSRSVPGTDFMFLVYYNWQAKLYNTQNHALETTFSPLTGSIKEIAVGPSNTPQRIYILYSDKIEMYTYTIAAPPVFTLAATKTISQLFSDISPLSGGALSIGTMFDITTLLLTPPYNLAVSLSIQATVSTYKSIAVLLDSTTLSLVPNSYVVVSTTALHPVISTVVDQSTGLDALYLDTTDVNIKLSWTGTGWSVGGLVDQHDVADNTYWDAKSFYRYTRKPYYSKTTPTFNPTTKNSFSTVFFGYMYDLYCRDSVQGNRDYINKDYMHKNRMTSLDHIRGNSSFIAFIISRYSIDRLDRLHPLGTKESVIESGFIMTGVPYQIANNSIFVTDGEDNLYHFSYEDCFENPTIGTYQWISAPCDVANCLYCNFFNSNQCRKCKSGYYVDNLGQCSAICPNYLLNSQFCVVNCPLEYYMLPSTAPKQCITASACQAGGKFILGDRCITTSCPATYYTTNSSGYCIPISPSTAAVYNDDTISVTICPAGTYYFYHYRQCTPIANLPTAGFNTVAPSGATPGYIYCDSSLWYFYDLVSQRCIQSCGLYQGTHPTMGMFCSSAPACQSIGYYSDAFSAVPKLLCSPSCPPALWTDMTTSSCVVSCPPLPILTVPSVRQCVSSCSLGFYTSPTQCLTKSECRLASWLPILSTMACIQNCQTGQAYNLATEECSPTVACTGTQTLDPVTNQCIENSTQNSNTDTVSLPDEPSNSSIYGIFKALMKIQSISKIVTPIMMASFFDIRSGSLLCLVAQTYTKLTLMTYLTFELGNNIWEQRYYTIFREFLDDANEALLVELVSQETVSENKRYVCAAGFWKLCLITVEDNYIPSNLLSFVIFGLQFLLLGIVVIILGLLRKEKLRDKLYHKLKSVMLYSFLLEKDMEFSFSLVLNSHILVFSIPFLSILKALGLFILLIYIFCLGSILISNKRKHKMPLPPAKQIAEKWSEILREIVDDRFMESFQKIYVMHDFIFAFSLVSGTFVSPYQMYLWAGVELLLTVLLLKFRVFKDKIMNIRQPLMEILFFFLSIVMAVSTSLKSRDTIISMIIFFTSIIILCLDILFMIFIYIQAIFKSAKEAKTENSQEQKIIIRGRVNSGEKPCTNSRSFGDNKLYARSIVASAVPLKQSLVVPLKSSSTSPVSAEQKPAPPAPSSRSVVSPLITGRGPSPSLSIGSPLQSSPSRVPKYRSLRKELCTQPKNMQ